MKRACTDGFSEARTFRCRASSDGYAPGVPSERVAPGGRIANISFDSVLAKHGAKLDPARIALGASSPDLRDRAAVGASPDSMWGAVEEVKGEFSVASPPRR